MLPAADQIYGDADFIFQQDLAPARSAKATSTWFKDHGIPVLNWPANSPDLNPIEKLWGIVKRKMRYARRNNAEELKATIRATWALITPEQCHRLIDSMPRRIADLPILDFMSATHSKQVGTGSNKRPEKWNVHIRNSWRTNLQLIRSIGNMIGYKKSLSEWQCLSEVRSYHHLLCIISSKDSENLEQSLCVRVKAGKPYWMPVIFRPLDSTASHTGMLL